MDELAEVLIKFKDQDGNHVAHVVYLNELAQALLIQEADRLQEMSRP
jgi:hypothetical protein